MPSSSHILLPLLFMSVFIYTSTSLLTYNFNQPIQLRRLLKIDPRRQMALIRLSDSMKRYEPSQMFVDLVDAQSAQVLN
uniref:Secreted protein n=1 Tax=Globodera pallida TaxID=36090 RepID=A0A183CCY5_GLOPA